jgi:hypothetical protein
MFIDGNLPSDFSEHFFMANALLISPKRFDETISDIYQDAGIWIVIASCVAEYLLLLTYIGVAAYDFFKNRRMMKKMNVQRKQQSLIKYSEASSSNSLCLRQPWVGQRAANKLSGRISRKGSSHQVKQTTTGKVQVRGSRRVNVEGLEKGVKESINKTRFGSKKNVGNARIEEKKDQMAVKKSLEVKGNQDDWKLRARHVGESEYWTMLKRPHQQCQEQRHKESRQRKVSGTMSKRRWSWINRYGQEQAQCLNLG